MDEVVSAIPTVVLLLLVALLGMAAALIGVDQIGASAAIHLGGYRAAQAANPGYGQHIAAGISENLVGFDTMGQSSWTQDALGRTIKADTSFTPSLGWMMGGRSISVKTGTVGRQEEIFPERPTKFE
jgi:hypothetical protein